MASHALSVARAAFTAGLLRPDASAPPVSREEISIFHRNLDDALSLCSVSHVETCKIWILKHITPSSARVASLGKYLVAISRPSTSTSNNSKDSSAGLNLRRPAIISPVRRRLHVLYLYNDVLHHIKYHERGSAVHDGFTNAVQPHLSDLISGMEISGAYPDSKAHARLSQLLNIWTQNAYFTSEFIDKLRVLAQRSGHVGEDFANGNGESDRTGAVNAQNSRNSREIPFAIPATHGDVSTPWYDVPAGNMMPHIVPNRQVSINTAMLKVLHLVAGPPDLSLTEAVKGFLGDVGSVYNEAASVDKQSTRGTDAMGQEILMDKESKEVSGNRSYYGWSHVFCERMKKRIKDGPPAGSASDGNSLSRSSSPDRQDRASEINSRKRRRYSSSSSRGPGEHRDANRSRSGTVSRSPSRSPYGRRAGRSRSPRRASHSEYPRQQRRDSPNRWMSARSAANEFHERKYEASHQSYKQSASQTGNVTLTGSSATRMSGSFVEAPLQMFSQPPPIIPLNHNIPFPLGSDGMPILPPPPPGYLGLWPPPPPPPPLPPLMPGSVLGMNVTGGMPFSVSGIATAPIIGSLGPSMPIQPFVQSITGSANPGPTARGHFTSRNSDSRQGTHRGGEENRQGPSNGWSSRGGGRGRGR